MKTNNIGKSNKAATIVTVIVMLLVLGGCIGALTWSLTGLKKNDNLMAKQKEQLLLENQRMKEEIIKETRENLIKEIKDKKLVEVVEVQDKVADEMIEKKLKEKSLVGKKYTYEVGAKTIEVDMKGNNAVLLEAEHSDRSSYTYLRKGASKVSFVTYMYDERNELHVVSYEVTWKGDVAVLKKTVAGYFLLDSNNEYRDRLEEYGGSYGISAVYF